MKKQESLIIADKINILSLVRLDYDKFLVKANLSFMDRLFIQPDTTFTCSLSILEKLTKRNYRLDFNHFAKGFEFEWDFGLMVYKRNISTPNITFSKGQSFFFSISTETLDENIEFIFSNYGFDTTDLLNLDKVVFYSEFQVSFGLSIPFDTIHPKLSKFSKLAGYYDVLLEYKIEPMEAKRILGIENPIVFDLLEFILKQSKLDLSDDSERRKIFYEIEEAELNPANPRHVQEFCDEYDMDSSVFYDILKQFKDEKAGMKNRFII